MGTAVDLAGMDISTISALYAKALVGLTFLRMILSQAAAGRI
jgi:hypothetical protein